MSPLASNSIVPITVSHLPALIVSMTFFGSVVPVFFTAFDQYGNSRGTVAATLTGLFFVAFSLRVRDLQLSVVIRTRAAYLLTLLVVIVVYSAFVVMPGQSRAALAAEILIVSVVGVAYLCGWCLPRLVRLAVFSVDLVVRWIAGVAGLLLGIGAGISMLAGNGGGLYLLAFGALLLIANEVASAWSLIVGIGKDTGAKDIMLVGQPTPEGPPAG